ncbi:WD40 repeat domain-containing protein [Hydrogenimonas urashimensis]|uniref:WD40 repeat domain-containing protein n=1 Tax=Hydrogenimonas urashimensis TaxID=2740515 RepID=UPI001915776C|nr:WD40 repeat domain-containing protein [Hydrogenimonas urashimensis]
MKSLLFFLLFAYALIGQDITPSAVFSVRGYVNDFVVSDGKLFVATDRGTVDIFDLKKMALVYQIVLNPTEDGWGERVPVRILSVDVQDRRILVTGIVKDGFRAVWLFENLRLKPIVDAKEKLMLKEAHFADDGHIVMGTFSSELIRYSLQERAPLYRRQLNDTAIGDMAMSLDRRFVVTSDESGAVRVVCAKTGKVVRELPSKHLDNVFHVAAGKDVIVTGGNDRRVCIFGKKRNYVIRTDFPVYCVGVSPEGKTGVYLKGDDQILQLFDIETGKETDRLVGHKALVNQIRFLDETTLLSSEKGPYVYLWKIKSANPR